MKKYALLVALAAILLPGLAHAQKGGACTFNGTATISPPIGSTPGVCSSASGCQQFQFGGSLAGPACGGLTGSSQTTTGKFYGPFSCSENIHGGSASTAVGTVSYNGVCAGALCVGVAYKTVGGFEYDLAFSTATVQDAIAKCPTNSFSSATFTGAAVGGSQ
jgi:hypothetical protein